MEAFTARNATKFVVTSLIKLKTADLVSQTAADHTRFDEDDIPVRIGASLVGWYVGDKIKPVTDKMVDTTADKITAFRQNRATKKSTETE